MGTHVTKNEWGGGDPLTTFWNACREGPFSVGNSCGPADSPASAGDKSALKPSTQQPWPPAQQQMYNIVEGVVSPFRNCVQPGLEACLSSDGECEADDMHEYGRRLFRNGEKYYSIGHPYSFTASNNGGCSVSGGSRKQLHNPVSNHSNVNVNDVLCGRGNTISQHVGNINFRDLVAANKELYGSLTKKDKMMLARQIVDFVLHRTDPPGRFVARDAASGVWNDIGISRSLEKTSQALRDKSTAGNTS
jgi:hypothetical protein